MEKYTPVGTNTVEPNSDASINKDSSMESSESISENRNTSYDPELCLDSESNESSDSQYTWDDEYLYLFRTNQLAETARLLNQRLVTNLNYQNAQGNSALHFTCANNLELATYYLLKVLKVNYWVLNHSGNSPLQWAVQNKCVGAIRVLLAHDYELNASRYAPKEGNPKESSWKIDKQLEITLEEQLKNIQLDQQTVKHYGLDHYSPSYQADNAIDILRKNKFGKSILSEAFECNDLEVLQLILEHPVSGCLDYLERSGGSGTPDSGDASAGQSAEPSSVCSSGSVGDVRYVMHELQFTSGASTTISVRELAIENDRILNALESELDLSGQIIWEASIMASYWLSHLVSSTASTANTGIASADTVDKSYCNLFKGKTVLELGAGCGLLGISLWVACELHAQLPKRLTLSDCSEKTLENLRHNLSLNALGSSCRTDNDDYGNVYDNLRGEVDVIQLNWKDFTAKEKYDIIIASDLVYDSQLVKPLVNVISQLMGALFLYTYKVSRDGADLFVEELKNSGFIVNVQRVSRQFQENPFPDKTKEYCLIFFPDLESDDYNFLTASRPPNV